MRMLKTSREYPKIKLPALESTMAGTYSVTINLGDAVFDIHWVGVELNNRDEWLLKYYGDDKITDTHYEIELYVVPMNDNDKNGIRDDFEMELAKRFCPSLKLNVFTTYCFPEPVEIMGGPHNSDIYVTITDGPSEDKEQVAIPAYMVEYYSQLERKWQGIITKEQFGTRWNYSEQFKTNPIVLYALDSLKTPYNKLDLSKGYNVKELNRKKNIWIHFNWEGGNVGDWWFFYKKEQDAGYSTVNHNGNYPHTIYCTMWAADLPGVPFARHVAVLQYWFFYPFDDGPNDHEGDWEHINIIANTQIPDRAIIDAVQFYFHEKWREYPASDLEIHDDTHVRVYVGGSFKSFWEIFSPRDGHMSGGSYPGTGHWRNVASRIDEYVHGQGFLLDWNQITNDQDIELDGKGIEILKDPNQLGFNFFNSQPELSWLKANIYFGEPHYDPDVVWPSYLFIFLPNIINDIGPTLGPYNHSGWRALGEIKGFGYYAGVH